MNKVEISNEEREMRERKTLGKGGAKSNEGSALLIALIIMGILLSLSLGVSDLLIGTLRDNRALLEKTRAWYAAESGMEHALYAISKNAPGFETTGSANLNSTDSRYEYRVRATASEIPSKEDYEIQTEEDSYAVLRLNESITIPLFRGAGDNDTVRNFKVDYYLTPNLQLSGGQLDDDLDILRWKIFGISTRYGTMEVINEFLPANPGSSPQSPTCLGTAPGCWNSAQFYERVLALDGSTEFHVNKEYRIETFLNEHTQNFLVLTNVVNTDLIAGVLSTRQKQQIATIRYRITEGEGQPRLTLPYIKIAADGFSGSTKQSLDLEVKRESFLPVFNYSLYRTAE